MWFSVSLGLLGIIIGYSAGSWTQVPGSAAENGLNTGQVQSSVAPLPVPAPPAPSVEVAAVDLALDHIRGNENAKIALIGYSDYECPFCKRAHPTYQQLLQEYDGQVMHVFRHFPLTSIHPNAQPTAEAAECVADLGGNEAFWTFTDAVFDDPDPFTKLPDIAVSSGVERQAFLDCVESGKFRQKIVDQTNGGQSAGVTGTPATFVYNMQTKEARMVSGAVPAENFKSVIDAMLQ